MIEDFLKKGFTEIINVPVKKELDLLQKLIYSNTKNLLVDHDENLSIEKKVNVNFKEIPSQKDWSNLMNIVNSSKEFNSLINSEGIKSTFKTMFKNPEPFDISTFRARMSSQKRVIYNWHQDEGTWYLSKSKNHLNKFPATLWFSINGANKDESIQLVESSHNNKLHNHNYVNGQGFFNIDNKKIIDENKIYTVCMKPSEGVIFHPLMLHRSVPINPNNLRPRYTIDIRYFDRSFKPNFKVDYKFQIKRFFKNFSL